MTMSNQGRLDQPIDDLIRDAMNLLARGLGLAGTARFLGKIAYKEGDYTVDRDELLEDLTVEELFEELQRMQALNSGGGTRTRSLGRRITANPDVCEGRPCIRGLPIPAHDVLGRLGTGLSPEQVMSEYPDLEQEDILAVYRYASRVIKRT